MAAASAMAARSAEIQFVRNFLNAIGVHQDDTEPARSA